MAIREARLRTGLRGTLVLQVVAEQEWKTKHGTTTSEDKNVVTRDARVDDIAELIERGFINRLGFAEQ